MRNKMLFYDEFASEFEAKMNKYEMRKRLDLIYDEMLKPSEIANKYLLDAGSGTGWFSQRATERGASVVSLDVGENILAQVAMKCETKRVVGSVLEIPFPDNTFDVVVCTEVIEHTPNPRQAVTELCRVLKPGGILILTVPNQFWKWACVLANVLKLRPYEGYENWVGYNQLKRWVQTEPRMQVKQHFGFNIIPCFVSFTYPLIDFFDRFGHSLGWAMVNIAIRAEKQ